MKLKRYIINPSCSSKKELFLKIGTTVCADSPQSNPKKIAKALNKREKQQSTGLESQIGVCHFHADVVDEPTVVVVRNRIPIEDYLDMSNQKITLAIAILAPVSADKFYLNLLGKICSLLLIKANVDTFRNGTEQQINRMLDKLVEKLIKETKVAPAKKPVPKSSAKPTNPAKLTKPDNNQVKKDSIIAVTSCAAGVAHTMMAADALEAYCKKQNIPFDIERQGSLNDKPTLKENNIRDFAVVIISADKNVEGMDRFIGKKVYFCTTNDSIKNAELVVTTALKKAEIYTGKKTIKGNTTASNKDHSEHHLKKDRSNIFASMKGRSSFMKHLLSGVSYMIPFIICGGILMALALGFFSEVKNGEIVISPGIGLALFTIAQQGFNFYIPILSAFIAYSIAGRSAFVPAFIVGYLVGNGTAVDGLGLVTMFNWNDLAFGYKNFLGVDFTSYSIGYIGAILTGFVSGYITLGMVNIKWPKSIQTIVPLIIIPIFSTLFTWALFAFFIIVPLIYLSAGLYLLLVELQKSNLVWLLGILIGFMICFDLGGPLNKIAFAFSAGLIPTFPWLMGIAGAAISVPPLGMALATLCGAKLKVFDGKDVNLGFTALILAFFGITEGAIPFLIKFPKSALVSNLLGGMVAGVIAALFLVSDNAAQGGMIVYVLAAVGKDGVTDYVYGLWYLFALVMGAIATAGLFVILTIFLYKPQTAPAKIKLPKISKPSFVKSKA